MVTYHIVYYHITQNDIYGKLPYDMNCYHKTIKLIYYHMTYKSTYEINTMYTSP